MRGRGYKFGHLTLFILPAIMMAGWIINLSWIIGFDSTLIPCIIFGSIVLVVLYSLIIIEWSLSDLRWAIAPICVVILADQLPWWQMKHVGLTDGMYHLIQANHYIGQIDNIPHHQGQDFLFRPPIVPGIFSIELLFFDTVSYTPLILLSFTCWQLQHLCERWSNKSLSSLIVIVIILVPVFRYWGQLPYADVPVAGLWIFLIHIAIQDSKSNLSVRLFGGVAGLVFLTKYVFIYAVGISCWLYVKDSSGKRAKVFLQGWFSITLPFFAFFCLTQGNPFSALTPQTNFAIDSAFSVVGEHDFFMWWEHLISQISIFGILGLFIGSYRLYTEFREEMKVIIVLLFPLLVIHIFILDFGTERYHTPWIALFLCICVAGLPIPEHIPKFREQILFRNNIISAMIVLLIATSNFSTISEEIENSERYISPRLDLYEFHIQNANELDEDSILLTGHDIPIILALDIEAYRFINSENTIRDSINEFDATHIITSDWNPRYQWEKEPIVLLGNRYIEPLSVNIDNNKLGILWEINYSASVSPMLQTNASSENVIGDLLVLYPNQSVSISKNNTLLSWIEVGYETSTNDVFSTLTGDTSNMIDGCYIAGKKSSSCEMHIDEILSTDSNSMIFAWFA